MSFFVEQIVGQSATQLRCHGVGILQWTGNTSVDAHLNFQRDGNHDLAGKLKGVTIKCLWWRKTGELRLIQ